MVNTYSPRRPAVVADIVVSSHGTLFVIEAVTKDARRFFGDLGFNGSAVVPYKTLREIRYASRDAGLSIQ